MSKGALDVFNIVVCNNWEPKHVYNELFEAIDTFGVAMVAKLWQLLNKFSFIQKIVAYVKDEKGQFGYLCCSF
jgi:hypothetical protein